MRFVTGDMMALPMPDASFDVVTTGYGLRNVPDLTGALREIHRVLRPGGQLLSLDFDKPANRIVRTVYLGYLTVVGSTLGAVLHGDPDTYRYIPESIQRYPGAAACVCARAAGGLRRVCARARAGWIPRAPSRHKVTFTVLVKSATIDRWFSAVPQPQLTQRLNQHPSVPDQLPHERVRRPRAQLHLARVKRYSCWTETLAGTSANRADLCKHVNLLDSLLDAIVRLDGDALGMHVGEKPHVVTTPRERTSSADRSLWDRSSCRRAC